MKRITNLTEDQAVAIAAHVVTYRAVRGAQIVRFPGARQSTSFAVEVDTYPAEENVESVVSI